MAHRALLFLYAESPVHAGGDSSLGAVDLPIQREAATRLPVIWAQSLKGALRSHARTAWSRRHTAEVFGDEPPGSEDDTDEPVTTPRPGSLSVGDGQLVAFPVPTVRETFAWATSPLVLGRVARKAGLAELTGLPSGMPQTGLASVQAASRGWCTRTLVGPYVTTPIYDGVDEQTAASGGMTGRWARWLAAAALTGTEVPAFFADKLTKDLLAVPDGVLRSISEECAELAARVQLKADEKTVRHGPFYSEYLPCETLLAALLECSDAAHLDDLRGLLDGKVLRLGGNETIGKGLLWCRFATPAPAPAPVTSATAQASATGPAGAGRSGGRRA
jgi:CRISPR-associated protein Cmr4